MEEDPLWPICQSCARPLIRQEDFGSNEDGSLNREYCICCFQNGIFVQPNLTMDEMIDQVVEQIVSQNGMPRRRADEITRSVIPLLKRWHRERQ